MGLFSVGLGEDSLNNGADGRLVGLAHTGQQVALERHATALATCAENRACGGFQARVRPADHQLYAPQAAPSKAPLAPGRALP